MEGIKVGLVGVNGGGGGGGRVGVGHEDDIGDGMQCSDHPYRNNPGGICAFCLQEKLGKLVSSSFPLPIRGSSSSSSTSPSFRSDIGVAAATTANNSRAVGGGGGSSLSLSSVRPCSSTRSTNGNGNISHYQEYCTLRTRIPFLLAKKKKKIMVGSSSASSDHAADIVFKRSKSTATPRSRGHHSFMDDNGSEDFSPRKRGFWSFLYHSSSASKSSSSKKLDKLTSLTTPTTTATETVAAASAGSNSVVKQKERCLGSSLSKKGSIVVIEDDDHSPTSQAPGSASSFERKVSRSRSVGCGSRSFSGDFFERISTGFGDCTLRRVESQREGKTKVASATSAATSASSSSVMKERVKCGGIFGGFVITSSSSSSSSSSYWVSSSAEENNGKSTTALAHGRSKSWGWAFASPMRAFSSKPSKDGKRVIIRESSTKNTTPTLAAIPSLLAVRG